MFISYLMSWNLLLGTITSSDSRRKVKVGQSKDELCSAELGSIILGKVVNMIDKLPLGMIDNVVRCHVMLRLNS